MKDLKIIVTTEEVKVGEWPYLIKPNKQYIKSGEYKATIIFDKSSIGELEKKINIVLNDKTERTIIEKNISSSEIGNIEPFKPFLLNDEVIKDKVQAVIKTKKKTPIFDKDNKKIKPKDIKEGSIIKVNIEITPYVFKDNGIYKVGVNLYYKAIQVIKLIETDKDILEDEDLEPEQFGFTTNSIQDF